MLTYLLPFAILIGIVIVAHELGHFLAAKAVGVRVERFSIGYPPKIYGKKIGETEYCLSAIPLGGYVKLTGMIDESLDRPDSITGAPYEFMSKSTLQKVLVISAGVIMNFLVAIVIYTTITAVKGIGYSAGPIVGVLQEGHPAAEAGLQVGDVIKEIDGEPIEAWEELEEIIHARPEMPVHLVVDRGGERLEFDVTPRRHKFVVDGEVTEIGLIGIYGKLDYRSATLREILSSGVTVTWTWLRLAATNVFLLFTGRASVKDLSGPIVIAKMSGESAKAGILQFFVFVALISVNIGFINILPFPVLDGGHLILILWEGISRRRISSKARLIIQQVGMVLLLALIVFILWNDVIKVGLFKSIAKIF